jgi:hypothetical protein
MAGTIFGLGLSQQVDDRGRPLSGGLLYFYEQNTSTPVTSYTDFALTDSQSWPVELDAMGRVPAFWLDDGSYRVRLTTSAGVVIFDEQSITAIGASSGTSGDSSSQDTSTLHQTGDFLWQPVSGTRSGWVRASGRTIGSGSSVATERANADTQSLFEWFWNNFSDSFCAVSGGRGGSATADFNANKVIATLDMRSKSILGLDDMGNTSAAITGSSTIAATAVGASTYTIVQANFPSGTLSGSAATITDTRTFTFQHRSTSDNVNRTSGGDNTAGVSQSTVTVNMASPASGTITGSAINLNGSGTDMDILTPSRVGTWYVKL